MTVIFSDDFIDSAERFPSKLKVKLDKLIQLLKENPFHPSLHTKYLSGRLSGLLSFRITRDWRVIFRFLEPDVVLFYLLRGRELFRFMAKPGAKNCFLFGRNFFHALQLPTELIKTKPSIKDGFVFL